MLLQPHIEPIGFILFIQTEHVFAAEQLVQPRMLQLTQVPLSGVVVVVLQKHIWETALTEKDESGHWQTLLTSTKLLVHETQVLFAVHAVQYGLVHK